MQSYRHPLLDILFRAVLALVTSALLLLLMFVLYIDSGVSGGTGRAPQIDILGKSMQVVVGSAEVRGEALAITAYQPTEDKLIAVAVWRGSFQAADYPLLQYRIDSISPGPTLQLIWRTTSDPGKIYRTDLNAPYNGSSWLNLARQPDWRGTVVEMGVYASATTAHQALSISHLTVQPLGWRGALASHWADWTSFRGWSARSINYLYGTTESNALSPVLVAAAWSALAISLLILAGLFARRLQGGALAVAVLVPWISVDLLWQNELMTQLAQSREQFTGKTVPEKHLADVDGAVYRYMTRLKNEVLPTTSARIVILHDSVSHNFDRLKAQYYLLPHNVYNFGRTPPRTGVDSIDYILILGTVPGMQFHPQTNSLVWQHGQRTLAVEQLDSAPMGSVYRVVHRSPDVEEKP